jgi:hypothetical protein
VGEAVDLAGEVLAEVRERLPLLTFNPDAGVAPRAIAAAGLVRALALVDAIEILETSGRADVAGALARLVLEVHHLSLYSLLGGYEALDVLWKDHAFHAKHLVDANRDLWDETGGDDVREMVAEWGDGELLRFATLRDCVDELLRDAGDDSDLTLWYDLLYRGESTFNVHGLGQIERYIDLETNPWSLRWHPEPVAAHGSYVTATVLVGHLAGHLFERHGIGTRELEARREALIETVNAERGISPNLQEGST